MDVGYWESLLQQLKAHIALTRLKEQHQAILKKRLAKLKQEVTIDHGQKLHTGIHFEFCDLAIF